MQTLGKKHVTLRQINSKKQEMYKKAKSFGMTHPLVVACSQELDVLLNQYQGIHQYENVVWIKKAEEPAIRQFFCFFNNDIKLTFLMKKHLDVSFISYTFRSK